MTTLLERAHDLQRVMVELRRDLHRHPELSFHEERTATRAAEVVTALGFRVRTGVGRTGVVADLEHGPGPTVALRADMDALPIQEDNDTAYRSTVPGVMHACGHDAHVAMLVGAAHLLAHEWHRGAFPAGTVRLLFQPSEERSDEEGHSGAARMIEAGALAEVRAVFGLHVGAALPSGKIYLRPGPMMAGSDFVRVTVEGTSAHAARPHEGTDAIVLASHVVLACQNIVARRISPTDDAVLTFGTIQGGAAENVLAQRVTLQGTLRYFDREVRAALHRELRAALGVAIALGGTALLDLRPGYPPLHNDPAMTDLATRAIRATLGPDAIGDFAPVMLSEDFAIMARHAPGCFFWLGAALDPPREHHHPHFDIDEQVLPRGASTLAACAVTALQELA